MPITVVQTVVQTANVTTSPQAVSATFPAPVTSGNLIVALAGAFCDGTPSVSIPNSGGLYQYSGNAASFGWYNQAGGTAFNMSWSGIGDATASGNPYLYLIGSPAYADASTIGGDTVTITATDLGNQSDAASSQLVLACFELSGQTPEYPPINSLGNSLSTTAGPVPASPFTLSAVQNAIVALAVARTHIPSIDGPSTSTGSGTAGVLQYRAAYKTGIVGDDAVYFSLSVSDLLLYHQVAIVLPPIRSSRPPGPFARIPASSFTR